MPLTVSTLRRMRGHMIRQTPEYFILHMIVRTSGIIIGHFEDLPVGILVYVIRPVPTSLLDLRVGAGSLPGSFTRPSSTMPKRVQTIVCGMRPQPVGWSSVIRVPATAVRLAQPPRSIAVVERARCKSRRPPGGRALTTECHSCMSGRCQIEPPVSAVESTEIFRRFARVAARLLHASVRARAYALG